MSSIVCPPASQAEQSAFIFSPHFSGRVRELQILHKTLQNAHNGSTVFTMIYGEAGVGKSTLAKAFLSTALKTNTFVLSSYYQRISESTPYAALSQCLQQLTRQILCQDFDTTLSWKKALQRTIKGDARILVEISPEIEELLPENDESEKCSTKNRLSFPTAATNFLRAASLVYSTLIIYLDDLHLADQADLELLLDILNQADLSRVMFIATHREQDNNYSRHFQVFKEKLSLLHPKIDEIHITPFSEKEIQQLLDGSFPHTSRGTAQLAAHCARVTGGNPLLLTHLLHFLLDDSAIFLGKEDQSWHWNENAVAAMSVFEHPAKLLHNRIERLSSLSRKLLITACCSGKYFTTGLLSELTGLSFAASREQLEQACRDGLLVPDPHLPNNAGPCMVDNQQYHFSHEIIRDVLFSQLSDGEISRIRFRIGQHLVQHLSSQEYEIRLFEVSKHLNHGIQFTGSRAEKIQLARINLSAGIRSKLLSAYSSAYRYLQTGLSCLDHESWNNEYSLCIGLHIEACDCAFLCANYDEVERLFLEVCSKSKNIFDKCHVYKAYIRALKAQDLHDKAVSTSLKALAMFEIHIPKNPGELKALKALVTTELRYLALSPTRLNELPEMHDRTAKAIISFLHEATSAALLTNIQLLPLLCAHSIRLSLRWGNDRKFSALGYMVHSYLLCTLSDKLTGRGCTRGKQALDLQRNLSGEVHNCQPALIYNIYMEHWQHHLKETLPQLRDIQRQSRQQHDETTAGKAALATILHNYLQGNSLSMLRSELDSSIASAAEAKQALTLARLQMLRQATANLMGEDSNHIRLTGRYFDESCLRSGFPHTHDPISYCFANIVKLIHAVLFGYYKQALYYSELARPYIHELKSTFLFPVYYFYDCLARIINRENQGFFQQLVNLQVIRANRKKLKRWAKMSPQNHGHRFQLIEAELERGKGKTERAMELYDEAIQLAKEHDFLHEEALSYELAARFYKSRKKDHVARMYMREARYCYHRWGAKAKVSQLNSMEIVSDSLYEGDDSDYLKNDHSISLVPGEGGSRLDMMTVIKASRILSSEIVFGELLKKMMWIMLESSRAQRGFIILKDGDEWCIKVHGTIYRNSRVKLTRTPVTAQDVASSTIINYVINSGTDVVLNDACKEGLFTTDPYILKKRPCSLLCMPIRQQKEIFCVLYLENNIKRGAFPPDRQELLNLLGTQAAISLKNSSLFEELESAVSRLNLEVEKRRETQLQLLHVEKLSALGRLSASVAHEFGNPLMGVRYLIEDFHKRSDLSDTDRQLLTLGLDECARMKKLIQDLQRFNKPSTGRFDSVDIHQLIDKVLLFQRKHFATNRIKVVKKFDNSVEEITLIEDQITQVLFNLTMNAVDAMQQFGGELKIATRKRRETVEIEVADTGTGIAYEDQGRVFEPFYSTKTEEDGTGLGLAISYGIVKHHNGSLGFVSKPHEGTAFTISLPRALVLQGELQYDQETDLQLDGESVSFINADSDYTPEQRQGPVEDC